MTIDQYFLKLVSLSPKSHRGFSYPRISSERLEAAAVNFTEAILGLLKCKAVRATYSTEILLDHDIIRYLFRGRGKLSGDRISLLYEKEDFTRLCLPPFWYYYLNQLGQGVAVNFPIKLKSVLKMSRKRFIVSSGALVQATMSPIEKLIITINRKACDQFSI